MANRDPQKQFENQIVLKELNSNVYTDKEIRDKERDLFNLDESKYVLIRPPFQFDYGTNMHFSGRFFANKDCFFLDTSDIFFGNNVTIGPRVQIYTSSHEVDVEKRIKNMFTLLGQVIIEDNVWIGGGAIINPRVTIGKNSVVASGSVVTKDVPPNTLVAGVPAKVVKEINNIIE